MARARIGIAAFAASVISVMAAQQSAEDFERVTPRHVRDVVTTANWVSFP